MQIRMIVALTAFSIGILSQASFSQTSFWHDISGMVGCYSMKEGSSGRLFAIRTGDWPPSNNGGLYISNDGGLSWYETSLNAGYFNEVVTRDEKVIISRDLPNTQRLQIQLSTNNGNDWSNINVRPPRYYPYYLNITDSGSIYGINFAQTGDPLIRYNGQSWDSLRIVNYRWDGFVSFFIIDKNDNFFLGTSNKLLLSRDYGVTWNEIISNKLVSLIDVSLPHKLVVGTNPSTALETGGGVFVSYDSGKTWTAIGLTGKELVSLSVSQTGKIFVSTTEGIYRYDEEENKWVSIGPGKRTFDGLLISSADRLFATNENEGIFYSYNEGNSWMRNDLRGKDIVSLTINDSGYIFAGTLGSGSFKSINNGASWEQISLGSICDYVYNLKRSGTDILASTDCGLFQTTDDGRSWTNSTDGYIGGAVYSIALATTGQIFSGTNLGVYRSTDNMKTWNQSGLASSKIQHISISNTNEIYAVSENDGIFLSTDLGATWINRGLSNKEILTLGVNSQGNIFAGAYKQIYRSTDNGVTWDGNQVDTTYISSLLFGSGQTIYAGTYLGVYASYNNGENWSRLSTSGLEQPFILSLAFDRQGGLLAGTYRGGVYQTSQPVTAVDEYPEFPMSFHLHQNFPNPFNSSTVIRYEIPTAENVSLKVFNLLGQLVQVVVNGWQTEGRHSVEFSANASPSGIYVYQLSTKKFTETRKMLLLR